MVNNQETINLESIDIILRNLKNNKNYYDYPKDETFDRDD